MATRTKIEIRYDEAPESPREWSPLGTMYRREYGLTSIETYHEDGTQVHGTRHEIMRGLSVAVEVDIPRSSVDPRDAGGWISASKDAVRKEYGALNDETRALARACIAVEAEVYRAYADGEVFQYRTWVETDCPNCGKPEESEEESYGGLIAGSEHELRGMIEGHFGPNNLAALDNAIENWTGEHPIAAAGTFEHGGLGT